MAGLDILTNVQERWSIDDLADAHEALDMKEEAEERVREESERAARRSPE